MLETAPLDFSEDDVMWIAYKLSGAAGAMGSEAIELINWLICFGCTAEGFIVVVADLADWMDNSYFLWAAYYALVLCCLIALYKRPGVHPVGIG